MWKYFALGIGLGFFAIIAHLVTDRYLLPIVLPMDQSVLEFSPPELGELEVNSTREFSLIVSNRSMRSLVLLPPKSTCGCISLDSQEINLPARGSIEIRFQIELPATPGRLSKSIVLSARDYPGLEWEIPVSGEIIARIWADPSEVVMEYEQQTILRTKIKIEHRSDIAWGKIITTDSRLSFTYAKTRDKSLVIELMIKPDMEENDGCGIAYVQIFDVANTAELLRIPVTWRPRPIFRCVPESLIIAGSQRTAGEEIEKTILVLTSLETKSSIKVETLVPWINVIKKQSKQFGIEVRLRVRNNEVPSTFVGPLLKISSEGRPALFLKGRQDS